MEGYSLRVRSIASTWLGLFFLLLLLLYLGFIEFFQGSQHEKVVTDLLNAPVRMSTIKNVNYIKFTNRIGSYALKKENNLWALEEPRFFPAKTQTIDLILNSLKSIKVQTIHQLEPINYQSFSLDKPVMKIELHTKTQENIIIKVGLINSINNSSYISVSGHDRIYQTHILDNKLQGLELSDFIESQIFSAELDQIKKIQIFHGKNSTPFNQFTNTTQAWSTKKYKTINTQKLISKIKDIVDIKAHMIIDKKAKKLQTFINNYLEHPLYKVKLTLKTGKIIKYKVSSVIKAISDLKIENKQYFLMSASNRPYPYLVNNSFLKSFIIRYQHIK